eukprot:1055625-Prorocentrum_minimum.AAC.1
MDMNKAYCQLQRTYQQPPYCAPSPLLRPAPALLSVSPSVASRASFLVISITTALTTARSGTGPASSALSVPARWRARSRSSHSRTAQRSACSDTAAVRPTH